MACSHIRGCELFVQFALNPALEIWKQNYCNSDFKNCVRYKMSKLGQPIPLTLLPNGKQIDINRNQDEFGTTALFNCIEKKRARMARSILKTTSVNVNASNVEGTTALMAAVESQELEMVTIMLEFNADVSKKNMHGQTAYDLAVELDNIPIAEYIAKHLE